MGAYWKKHQKKEVQQLLEMFDQAGWTIVNPPKYYKVYCPCPDRHKTNIHLTPSDPNYVTHTLQWARNQTCYTEN